ARKRTRCPVHLRLVASPTRSVFFREIFPVPSPELLLLFPLQKFRLYNTRQEYDGPTTIGVKCTNRGCFPSSVGTCFSCWKGRIQYHLPSLLSVPARPVISYLHTIGGKAEVRPLHRFVPIVPPDSDNLLCGLKILFPPIL